MAEPERVRIRIRGTQKDAEGAVQHTEMQAVARHDGKGGKHYLRYEDRTLLAGQAVPSLLKFSENGLTLVRHGAVEQRLEFVRGAERQGLYRSPYGNIPLTVRTHELSLACQADGTGRIALRYDLFLQGAFQGSCALTIEIEAE